MDYARPATTPDAVALLGRPGTAALGGGTDLLVAMREGIVRLDRVVDLRGLPGAEGIEWREDGSVRIGASTRIATIAADPQVRTRLPALAQACESVGSPALRNMGTLGGNLCQRPRCWYFRAGVPCLKAGGTDCPAVDGENTYLGIFGGGPCFAVHPSDPAVVLSALEATIVVAGPAGPRAIPVGEFFVLPGPDPRRETVLEAGEFVVAVEVPGASSGGRQHFEKALQRGAWDFALVSIAAVRRADGAVRIVLGGVAPVPWRVNPSVEEDVASAPLSADDAEVLAERAMYDANPLSKNGYKVTIARNLIRAAIEHIGS